MIHPTPQVEAALCLFSDTLIALVIGEVTPAAAALCIITEAEDLMELVDIGHIYPSDEELEYCGDQLENLMDICAAAARVEMYQN